MKANEAPEKIWLGKYTQSLMLSNPNSNTYVEYVHKDAFIEKACEFWVKNQKGFVTYKDIVDFKKYMKGE